MEEVRVDDCIVVALIFYSCRYDCLPERYNWKLSAPDVRFYPLRPELVESTYLLYRCNYT